MSDVALFDLDGTLLDCNSGRLWIAGEWRAGRLRVRDVARAAWWLGRYRLGLESGIADAYRAGVATLAGLPEAQLVARTDAWFAAEVAGRLRPGARRVLDRHRAAGARLVLATSSSTYAAAAAVRTFGLDEHVATRFAVDPAGALTGGIEALVLGDTKARAVADWAAARGVDLADATFYTDSVTDRALLEAVGRPVVVAPDRPLARLARRNGWPIEDWSA